MIRLGGVSAWRTEWGNPTRAIWAGILSVVTGGIALKINAVGRSGWPGDAFFIDRLAGPLKFYVCLGVLAVICVASFVVFVSSTWELVVAFRRDSDRL